jgi:RNase P/RNase MRP subunit p30
MKLNLINEENFNKAREKIRNTKNEKVIFSSDNDDLNRKIVEKEKIDFLLIKQKKRRDYQKQRNSGFNEVLAKIVKEKNISLGIYLDEILKSNKYEKSKILARIKQNIFLCNKNKIKIVFVFEKEKRNLYDLKSLGLVLGMPTWMTKNLQLFEINK